MIGFCPPLTQPKRASPPEFHGMSPLAVPNSVDMALCVVTEAMSGGRVLAPHKLRLCELNPRHINSKHPLSDYTGHFGAMSCKLNVFFITFERGNMKYILAHDLGTSGNKATLYTDEGAQKASATVAYPSRFFNGSWAEQEPEDWWKAVCDSTQALLAQAGVSPSEIAVDRKSTRLNSSH